MCVYVLYIWSSLSAHRPWQSHPTRWPQPGAHTPTSHSTLRAPGPCVARGSPARAASRPGCSVAHRRSAHHGTCTGTYSWGKRSGHSDRQNRPKHTHLPHELEEKDKIGKSGKSGFSLVCRNKKISHSGLVLGKQCQLNNVRIHLCIIRSFTIYMRSCIQCLGLSWPTHRHRYQSSCGRWTCIHIAALYVCHRGSFQSTPALSDGHTPDSRRSHPG